MCAASDPPPRTPLFNPPRGLSSPGASGDPLGTNVYVHAEHAGKQRDPAEGVESEGAARDAFVRTEQAVEKADAAAEAAEIEAAKARDVVRAAEAAASKAESAARQAVAQERITTAVSRETEDIIADTEKIVQKAEAAALEAEEEAAEAEKIAADIASRVHPPTTESPALATPTYEGAGHLRQGGVGVSNAIRAMTDTRRSTNDSRLSQPTFTRGGNGGGEGGAEVAGKKKPARKAMTAGIPLGVFLEVASLQREQGAGARSRFGRESRREHRSDCSPRPHLSRRGTTTPPTAQTPDRRETPGAVSYAVWGEAGKDRGLSNPANHITSGSTAAAAGRAPVVKTKWTVVEGHDRQRVRHSVDAAARQRAQHGPRSEQGRRSGKGKEDGQGHSAPASGSQNVDSLQATRAEHERKRSARQGRSCHTARRRACPTEDVSLRFNGSAAGQLSELAEGRGWRTCRREYTSAGSTEDPERLLRRELQQLKQQLAFSGKQRGGKGVIPGAAESEGDEEQTRLREEPQGGPYTLALEEREGMRSSGFDPRRLRLRGHRLHAREKPSKLKAAMQLERKVRSQLFAGPEASTMPNRKEGGSLFFHGEAVCPEKKMGVTADTEEVLAHCGDRFLLQRNEAGLEENQEDREGGLLLEGGGLLGRQVQSEDERRGPGGRPLGSPPTIQRVDDGDTAGLLSEQTEEDGTAGVAQLESPRKSRVVADLPSSEKSPTTQVHSFSRSINESQSDKSVRRGGNTEQRKKNSPEFLPEQEKPERLRPEEVPQPLTEEASLRLQMLSSEDVWRYELCKQLSRLKKKHHASFASAFRPPAQSEDDAISAGELGENDHGRRHHERGSAVLMRAMPGDGVVSQSSPQKGEGATQAPARPVAALALQEEDRSNRKEARTPVARDGNLGMDAGPVQSTKSETSGFVGSYVDMVVGEDDWENALYDFLANMNRLQTRLLKKSPHKFVAQRRYVLGFKAARQALMGSSHIHQQNGLSEESVAGVEDSSHPTDDDKKKPKLIVIAANCEPSVSKGGLSDVIADVLRKARERNVPYVFSASRNKLKRALATSMRQSCVTFQNVEGVEAQLRNLLTLAGQKREAWLERQAPRFCPATERQ